MGWDISTYRLQIKFMMVIVFLCLMCYLYIISDTNVPIGMYMRFDVVNKWLWILLGKTNRYTIIIANYFNIFSGTEYRADL